MCANCGEARKTVEEEVVRRTGESLETVQKVLRALEELSQEIMYQEQKQMEAEQALMDRLREAAGAGAAVSIVEIGPDGFARSLAPGAERDVQEVRYPGQYL